jgi:DNA-binding CsgD family transcriptional regulator
LIGIGFSWQSGLWQNNFTRFPVPINLLLLKCQVARVATFLLLKNALWWILLIGGIIAGMEGKSIFMIFSSKLIVFIKICIHFCSPGPAMIYLGEFENFHAISISEKEAAMENELCQPHKAGKLSQRELEIFNLLLQGLSNKKIALSLGIRQKTVEEHLTSIYSKLGVKSRVEAILWGIEHLRDSPH